jgi:hypothetical protein
VTVSGGTSNFGIRVGIYATLTNVEVKVVGGMTAQGIVTVSGTASNIDVDVEGDASTQSAIGWVDVADFYGGQWISDFTIDVAGGNDAVGLYLGGDEPAWLVENGRIKVHSICCVESTAGVGLENGANEANIVDVSISADIGIQSSWDSLNLDRVMINPPPLQSRYGILARGSNLKISNSRVHGSVASLAVYGDPYSDTRIFVGSSLLGGPVDPA